jgi:hypothetical protein
MIILEQHIRKVNRLTNEDCIFVGSVASWVNNIIEWDKVKDIDFIVTNKNNLTSFNNLIRLNESATYKNNVRYYQKNKSYCYDIFLREAPQKKYVKEFDLHGEIIKELCVKLDYN